MTTPSDAGVTRDFASFEEFWPFYVSQHRDRTCRALHVIGTTLALGCATNPLTWPAVPLVGYGFSWVGHFVFEKNRPAAFKHPLWSLAGDLRMWRETMRGRMGDALREAERRYPAA